MHAKEFRTKQGLAGKTDSKDLPWSLLRWSHAWQSRSPSLPKDQAHQRYLQEDWVTLRFAHGHFASHQINLWGGGGGGGGINFKFQGRVNYRYRYTVPSNGDQRSEVAHQLFQSGTSILKLAMEISLSASVSWYSINRQWRSWVWTEGASLPRGIRGHAPPGNFEN